MFSPIYSGYIIFFLLTLNKSSFYSFEIRAVEFYVALMTFFFTSATEAFSSDKIFTENKNNPFKAFWRCVFLRHDLKINKSQNIIAALSLITLDVPLYQIILSSINIYNFSSLLPNCHIWSSQVIIAKFSCDIRYQAVSMYNIFK